MQAIVQDAYGPIDILESREVDKPVVGEREVLVRVRAISVAIGDVFMIRGTPFPVRLASGLRRPKSEVPGLDLAGVVEAVGAGVTQFHPGDEVFGEGRGTLAEYAIAAEDKLAPKPASLSFEEAAALPTSAIAALQLLRTTGRLQPGQRVLVNGASGGVGTFAVQIAKALGAEVTGVCSTANVDLVRSIGADHVIDYTREDFTNGGPRYDLILDNVENHSLSDCRRALTPKGTLVLNSGTGSGGLRLMVKLVQPILLSPFVGHTLRRGMTSPNHDDLQFLKSLVDEGRLHPVIDRTYPLRETVAALHHVEQGHARGKVVVAVAA